MSINWDLLKTGTIQKSASIDSFYTNVTFDRVNGCMGGTGIGGNVGGMYAPGNVGVPLRSLSNKPTSQGDLSMKQPAAQVGHQQASGAKNHSMTDIENKSSGSLDGHTSSMSAPAAAVTTATAVTASTKVNGGGSIDPDLSFLEQITRMQSKRLDDQRCSLKPPPPSSSVGSAKLTSASANGSKNAASRTASTIPNEDFFDLIIKSQRTRFAILILNK